MSPLKTKLLNVGLYQVGWFCCVLGASWPLPSLGALSALLLTGLHLLLSDKRSNELLRMLIACSVGVSVDSLQQALGVFTFTPDPGWPLWLPLWVFVVWIQFATLFRYGLYWLSGRYRLASALGMLGGPLAYWGGARLGAATLGDNLLFSVLSLVLVWGLVIPAFVWLSDRGGAGEGVYRWPWSRAGAS